MSYFAKCGDMDKILILGGSGYIGTILSDHLSEKGNDIINIDPKIYTDQTSVKIKENIKIKNFSYDFRDLKKLDNILKEINHIVILGGLVGDFITNKYLKLSQDINEKGLINFIDNLDNYTNIEKVIFVSTCSNYGIANENKLVSETDELKPLSPYAKSKVKIEKYIESKKNKVSYVPTILRFATAFGYSPRMRFDLTVNHFSYSIFKEKNLEIYDANTWRPYCHVKDFARLIYQVLNTEKSMINFQVFNSGGDINNFTKIKIAEMVSKKINGSTFVENKEKSLDRRDYRVSFKKVKDMLGFEPQYSVEDGINEVIKLLNDNKKYLNCDALSSYGNFKILDHVKK